MSKSQEALESQRSRRAIGLAAAVPVVVALSIVVSTLWSNLLFLGGLTMAIALVQASAGYVGEYAESTPGARPNPVLASRSYLGFHAVRAGLRRRRVVALVWVLWAPAAAFFVVLVLNALVELPPAYLSGLLGAAAASS